MTIFSVIGKTSDMELIHDVQKFEELQQIFIREIIEQIRLKLLEAGFTGNKLEELTTRIAFSVASTIDDNAVIESEGVEAHPYLTFSGEEGQLIHCGENSFAHEFVASVAGKVFSK
jgi:hypothetical protein